MFEVQQTPIPGEVSDEERQPERTTRRQTEKGRIYVAELRWKECFALQKKISSKINAIDSSISNNENRDVIERQMEVLKTMSRQLPEAHGAWVAKLTDDEAKADADAWLDEQTRRVREFEIKISEWLANAEIEDIQERTSTASKFSRRSARTYRTYRSTGSPRARERARAAELMAKVKFLEKKQELRNQAEKLELEEELSIAQAKEQTFAELEEEEKFQDLLQSPEEIPPPVIPLETVPVRKTLSADAPPYIPCRVPTTTHSLEGLVKKQNELTEMLADQQRESLLPPLVLNKFDGDPMELHGFMSKFETQIEAKLKSSDACLRYLEQYLEGEPKELIKSCVHSGPMGYFEAKQLISERYGDPYIISNAYIRKVTEWPAIRNNDTKSLKQFAIFLTRCKSAIGSMSYLNVLNHPHNIQCLVTKLPYFLQDRWRRDANKLRQRDRKIPGFAEFADFVNVEAKVQSDPVFSREALDRVQSVTLSNKPTGNTKRADFKKQGYPKETTRVTLTNDNSCPLCGNSHDLDACTEYLKKTLEERKSFLKETKRCFACYGTSHTSKGCLKKRTCAKCNRNHPTGMHDDNFRAKCRKERRRDVKETATQFDDLTRPTESPSVMNAHVAAKEDGAVSLLPIVPIRLRLKDKEVVTYAMLDNCSTGTFITESIRRELNVEGTSSKLMLRTMNGTRVQDTVVIRGLQVSDLSRKTTLTLPKTYTREEIPASTEEIPTPEMARTWPHIRPIADKIQPLLDRLDVGVLIGTNCPKALQPLDFRTSADGGPYAVLTFAGWTVVGPMSISKKNEDTFCSYRIAVHEVATSRALDHHFAVSNIVKELMIPSTDESSHGDLTGEHELALSIEDRRFLKKVRDGTQHVAGHYVVPLPFKTDNPQLPDNRAEVLQRTNWLKKKFANNPSFHQDYVNFMEDIIQKDYARRIPNDLLKPEPGSVWYIPHHGIYHPKKPHKIRVVFDCSAKFHGTSLNDQLLQGPDLTSSLIGVLTRFRQEPVAFMSDIEAMFLQIRVPEIQRNCLRFLWWPKGNTSQDLKEYQMNVHLFGAVSSPSCANYSLRRCADDVGDDKIEDVKSKEVLKKNFYVDDCLRSEASEAEAIARIKDVRFLCAHGGFHLTQFICNKRDVLETIPEDDRAKGVKVLDLNNEQLPIERALGVQWSVENDELGFRIILKDKPLTRRGILSTMSTVYDPLGFAAPVLLYGKKILQDLCRENLRWDDEIPEAYRHRWEQWRNNLPILEQFTLQRCLKPEDFGSVTSRQIHNFSDASTTGYGQVSYLRQVDDTGKIHCAFLFGKARLAPIKTVTIPRLELAAAVTSAKVSTMLCKELELPISHQRYWTDSTTVLQYISNEEKRFSLFVANRVQTIRDHCDPKKWRYVESKVNPADHASRGMTPQNLLKPNLWIDGPIFLWKPENEWPHSESEEICLEEVSNISAVTNVSVEYNRKDIIRRFERFSSWYRLKVAIAWLMRLKPKPLSDGQKGKPVTVNELHEAEIKILQIIQEDAFSNEITGLKLASVHREEAATKKEKAKIKKTSRLYRLDPMISKDGLVRVGGRLRKSLQLEEELKHPIIVPRKGHVTTLIIRDAHERTAHGGRGITLCELRNRFWVINANSATRFYISKCVTCRRFRSRPCEQKMADLPIDRVTPEGPFSYCGMDYFGPFLILERRKELKRYGVIFTCLASRAVHIETANSLETHACINALRRFIARRGPVREMRSDNGTNLVGSERELRLALKELNHEKISETLKREFNADWIIWKRNPPTASHMGGIWERQIRSIRAILTGLLKEQGHALDDESLRTFMTEAECIINSRPLTFMSDNSDDLEPLTPNHILTMKSKVIMPPPGSFQRADIYLRKRWRRVQYLANVFWTRWKKEYLINLQERPKWCRSRRNLKVGDIVMMAEENVPRGQWKLARIVKVYSDKANQVRSVQIKTYSSLLDRPVNKLILLLEKEDTEDV